MELMKTNTIYISLTNNHFVHWLYLFQLLLFKPVLVHKYEHNHNYGITSYACPHHHPTVEVRMDKLKGVMKCISIWINIQPFTCLWNKISIWHPLSNVHAFLLPTLVLYLFILLRYNLPSFMKIAINGISQVHLPMEK